MPTQEERLTTVEYDLKHFKTETIKAYGDVAMELVMVKGLTEDAVKRLMSLRITLDEHTTILNDHTTRLNRIEAMLAQVLERLPEKPYLAA
jgi:hypothetical protein